MSRESEQQPEVFFNIGNGELYVGQAAFDLAIEEGGVHPLDVQPIQEVLLNPEVPIYKDNYALPWRPKLTEKDLVSYGKWISSMVKAEDPEGWTKDSTLQRAYQMGLGPGPNYISPRFDRQMWKFREAVGETGGWEKSKYSEWTTRDFLNYGKQVIKSIHGKKPRTIDFHRRFKRGAGPSPSYIRDHIEGGIETLQELLGFPDVSKWGEDDYIAYGVKVMRANPGVKITARAFDELSKRKRGPSAKHLSVNFDAISNYQERIQEEYELEERIRLLEIGQKSANYHDLVQANKLPIELDWAADSAEHFIILCARFEIVDRLAQQLSPSEKLTLTLSNESWTHPHSSRFRDLDISLGRLETEAFKLGTFDDLWPMNDFMKYLKLSPKTKVKPTAKIPQPVAGGGTSFLHTQTGQLYVGQDAYHDAIESGVDPRDLKKVGDLLAKPDETLRFGGITRSEHYHDWSLEENAIYGKWIASMVECPDGLPSRDLFRNAYRLGLGPGEGRINILFNTYGDFQRLVFYEQGDHQKWGEDNFVGYLFQLEHAVGHKPQPSEIDNWANHGLGPNSEEIAERYGSLDQLYELMGYVDTTAWDKDDMTMWGTRVMEANAGATITKKMQQTLQKQGRGPSVEEITHIFGDWQGFKDHLRAEYPEYIQEQEDSLANQVAVIDGQKQAGIFPPRFEKFTAQQPEEIVRVATTFLLVNTLDIKAAPDKKMEIAEVHPRHLMNTLLRHAPAQTAETIEDTAKDLHIHNIVWPRKEYMHYLKVA